MVKYLRIRYKRSSTMQLAPLRPVRQVLCKDEVKAFGIYKLPWMECSIATHLGRLKGSDARIRGLLYMKGLESNLGSQSVGVVPRLFDFSLARAKRHPPHLPRVALPMELQDALRDEKTSSCCNHCGRYVMGYRYCREFHSTLYWQGNHASTCYGEFPRISHTFRRVYCSTACRALSFDADTARFFSEQNAALRPKLDAYVRAENLKEIIVAEE